jgi:ADP-ribosylglycohydrolase
MALRLVRSLIHTGRFDERDVLARYLEWWRTEGFDTGPTAAYVFRAIDSGVPPAEAVTRAQVALRGYTGGCNPAHRSSPLALARFVDDGDLADVATREALLTHFDPISGDVAAAVVTLCRALVHGVDWTSALERAGDGRLIATRDALSESPEAALDRGGYAPNVLRAAVYFVGRADGIESALESSLAFAGRANYSPVLVGAIAGARWGAEAISSRMLSHCSNRAEIEELATILAEL